MKLPLNKISDRTKNFCGALLFIAGFIIVLMFAEIEPSISTVTITYDGVE